MNLVFNNVSVNIEGLTNRQLALIEELVYNASRKGGYQIDIDDYKIILEGFNKVDIKSVYDLDKEKEEIETNIRNLMKNSNLK